MFRRLPGTTLFPYTTLFRSMPHRSPIRRGPAGRMAMDSDGIGATPLLMDGAGDHIPIGDAGPMPRGALHGEPRAAPSRGVPAAGPAIREIFIRSGATAPRSAGWQAVITRGPATLGPHKWAPLTTRAPVLRLPDSAGR